MQGVKTLFELRDHVVPHIEVQRHQVDRRIGLLGRFGHRREHRATIDQIGDLVPGKQGNGTAIFGFSVACVTSQPSI